MKNRNARLGLFYNVLNSSKTVIEVSVFFHNFVNSSVISYFFHNVVNTQITAMQVSVFIHNVVSTNTVM